MKLNYLYYESAKNICVLIESSYHNGSKVLSAGCLVLCGARFSDGDGIENCDVTQDGEPRCWRCLGAGEGSVGRQRFIE